MKFKRSKHNLSTSKGFSNVKKKNTCVYNVLLLRQKLSEII